MAVVPPDPQSLNDLKTLVGDRLRKACPPLPPPGASETQLLAHWYRVVDWLDQRYAEVGRFARRAYAALRAGPPPDVSFFPPDVIRIDAIAKMSADDLRQTVENGIALMTARLTMIWIEGVLGPLHAAGTLGRHQDFGAGCRFHLPSPDGSPPVEADLMQPRLCSAWRLPLCFARLAHVPPWMGATVFSGDCIRLVQGTACPVAKLRFRVACLRFGPFVLATKPRLRRPAPAPFGAMGRILGGSLPFPVAVTACVLLAASAVAALFWLSPVRSAVVTIAATLAFLLILLGNDSHASPPPAP